MILVIDENRKAAANLAGAFSYMGFLSVGVTPSEALEEISPLYRAVIVTSAAKITSLADFVRLLRERADTPIFSIADKPCCEDALIFDGVIERGAYAAVIAERIIEYCDGRGLLIPGHYTALGIDVSADLEGATYFWQALPFTKTECMILRYLIRAYPTPVSAERILEYAYRPSRRPDAANIRTHISIMNKKFKGVTGKQLIEAEFGEGYRIIAPVSVSTV